jgi:phosphoribosylcarboxyaminoimidazole (NCAIR) mutase
MPKGVPVATVAIGGAENAGLLAAQILAGRYTRIADRVKIFRKTQTEGVLNSPEGMGTSLGNLQADRTSRSS